MKTPGERRAALEVEAVRIKARLDELAKQIDGDPSAWLKIQERLGGDVAEVLIDKPLAEARQQATTLAAIVRALDGTATQESAGTPAADPGDDLAKRRDEKLKAAQGNA
jgi:hypothetical protein